MEADRYWPMCEAALDDLIDLIKTDIRTVEHEAPEFLAELACEDASKSKVKRHLETSSRLN